ncbi:hypothetical protein NZD89_14605 [Alicyclobacillus fastidiosus]|uniref:Cobalamin biosynthesis protein CobT VWA domain-containing protein n=1 Tax=Alicyclobacillus fastidiosus TaxID=392011 RepID=A0ABY6Z9U4_9BACL|nr:hypothetical protein [Alicyclobacillus fastidiosus]WAH39649.1 hypothetical protein NZD89_14605 [Alicyclobacillus fastidiosus]GMA60857.1 VWA domain-containing protein [Alicyclobacillus fastidiosus]
MQTFRFDAPSETWWVQTQLADLAVALSHTPDLKVSYGMHSVWRWEIPLVTISTFWESLGSTERMKAQKADVYLRAVGNRLWTQRLVMRQAWMEASATRFPKLTRQLLCAAEDARLGRLIAKMRPGAESALRLRSAAYGRLLQQNRLNRERDGHRLDLLFTDAYLLLNAVSSPHASERADAVVETLQMYARSVGRAGSTEDVASATLALTRDVERLYPAGSARDTGYDWFDFDTDDFAPAPIKPEQEQERQPDAKHRDPLQDAQKAQEQRREQIEVWTQEQNSRATGAFSMENQENQSVPAIDQGAREGEDTPDSVITRRGHANSGVHQDHGEAEEDTELRLGVTPASSNVDTIGVRYVERHRPGPEAQGKVAFWESETKAARRKLVKLFDATLLHAMQARQENTRHGRLDKRLTRLWTEEHPRLFYHKSNQSKWFDVAVQLLVDCSGSMYERLEAMKPTLYLFHKTFSQLHIAHDVCGFWEDTLGTSVTREAQPVTHLLHAVRFSDDSRADVAPYLDLLEPQLDNRDGYAIREVGEQLLRRQERQKWLIVVSDGEPAAEDYRDAVIDTKNAIRALEAKGVHILHLCVVSPGETHTTEMLKQMYGQRCVVVHDASQFPAAMERALSLVIRQQARG